eukprot:13553342-Heterocapsa_arctica.AAC.1
MSALGGKAISGSCCFLRSPLQAEPSGSEEDGVEVACRQIRRLLSEEQRDAHDDRGRHRASQD